MLILILNSEKEVRKFVSRISQEVMDAWHENFSRAGSQLRSDSLLVLIQIWIIYGRGYGTKLRMSDRRVAGSEKPRTHV